MLWEEDEDTGEREGNSQSRPRRIRRKLKQHSERGGYDLVLEGTGGGWVELSFVHESGCDNNNDGCDDAL